MQNQLDGLATTVLARALVGTARASYPRAACENGGRIAADGIELCTRCGRACLSSGGPDTEQAEWLGC